MHGKTMKIYENARKYIDCRVSVRAKLIGAGSALELRNYDGSQESQTQNEGWGF